MPTIDLIEKRLIPQTPCPEVQPPPILVPNPTKKPAREIKTKELVTLNSIFEGEIIIINKGPKTKPIKNSQFEVFLSLEIKALANMPLTPASLPDV